MLDPYTYNFLPFVDTLFHRKRKQEGVSVLNVTEKTVLCSFFLCSKNYFSMSVTNQGYVFPVRPGSKTLT